MPGPFWSRLGRGVLETNYRSLWFMTGTIWVPVGAFT